MDLFYNFSGVGDVLMISLQNGERKSMYHQNFGDITKIMDVNGDVAGYNIFQASQYFKNLDNGKITPTESLLDEINQLFKQEGLDALPAFDFSPKFVIGYVVEKVQHENADKLSVCQVDVGGETLQIVCGAANVDQGQKVVVAKIGATMPSGLKIKPTTLRGIPSNGMICSRKELNLPVNEEEKGIYILSDSCIVGEPFIV